MLFITISAWLDVHSSSEFEAVGAGCGGDNLFDESYIYVHVHFT